MSENFSSGTKTPNKQTRILQNTLLKDPVKREHFETFMTELLLNGHAEIAPAQEEECWYLPLFHHREELSFNCVQQFKTK